MSHENQSPPPVYPATAPNYQLYNEHVPLQPYGQQQEAIPLNPQQLTHHSPNNPDPTPLTPQQVTHHDHSPNSPDASTASDDSHSESILPEVSQRYLNLEFDACFHEHKKTKLFNAAHHVLGLAYKWIKLITYHIFVFVIGVPLMFIWAIVNGIMAFIYSWIWSPLFRLTIFWLAAVLPLITVPLVVIYRPLVDVSARIFSKMALKANLNGQLYATPPQTV